MATMYSDQVANYDEVSKMSQAQLELAWLGCIFSEPERCRENGGLHGLDHSMFHTVSFYECGSLWLRELNCKTSGDLLDEFPDFFAEMGIISKLASLDYTLGFLPCFFKQYAREIERRSDGRFDCPWPTN